MFSIRRQQLKNKHALFYTYSIDQRCAQTNSMLPVKLFLLSYLPVDKNDERQKTQIRAEVVLAGGKRGKYGEY